MPKTSGKHHSFMLDQEELSLTLSHAVTLILAAVTAVVALVVIFVSTLPPTATGRSTEQVGLR